MKKLKFIIPILTLFLTLNSVAQTKDVYFDFKIKETKNGITDARFKIENSVNIELLKKSLYNIKGIEGFTELNEKENYYKIMFTNDCNLNEIRTALINLNTDFDRSFLIINSKNYYN